MLGDDGGAPLDAIPGLRLRQARDGVLGHRPLAVLALKLHHGEIEDRTQRAHGIVRMRRPALATDLRVPLADLVARDSDKGLVDPVGKDTRQVLAIAGQGAGFQPPASHVLKRLEGLAQRDPLKLLALTLGERILAFGQIAADALGELAGALDGDIRIAANAKALRGAPKPRVKVEALAAGLGNDELQARNLIVVVVV